MLLKNISRNLTDKQRHSSAVSHLRFGVDWWAVPKASLTWGCKEDRECECSDFAEEHRETRRQLVGREVGSEVSLLLLLEVYLTV